MNNNLEFTKEDYEKLKSLIEKLGDGNDIFNETKEIMKAYEEFQQNDVNYLNRIENIDFDPETNINNIKVRSDR